MTAQDALAVLHPVPVEDAPGWVRALLTTHLHDPHGDPLARDVAAAQREWEPDRIWGVRDRDTWVATLATEQRTLTVPGAGASTIDVTVDGLTAVAVAATHRRHGLLTRMLTESLRAAKDRGDALSMLIAAEWPIYGRFGYAPATVTASYRFFPRQAGRPQFGDPSRVRAVHRGELGAIAPAVFDAARRLRAGQVDRHDPWWQRNLGIDPYPAEPDADVNWYLHEGPDGPDGLLGWKATRDFGLNGPMAVLKVKGPIAATEEAYLDLWAYLCGIDAVEQVDLETRPVDEPIRWVLTDGRALKLHDLCDMLWLRILDVPAALAGRRYATAGQVVLEVVDPDGDGFAAGRFRLTSTADGAAGDGAADDGAACEPTSDPADLRISQRALSSIYLGGHRLRQLGGATAVHELSPGALDLVDLMFSTSLPPWTQTWF